MTMTINVPIRPGAALADGETRRFVEANVLNAEYSVVVRKSYLPDRAYNKDGIVNVLANYPWREFGYKHLRWQRVPVVEQLGGLIPWRAWEKRSTTLLLTDPRSGHEVAEMQGLVKDVEAPAGRLLFAGEPGYGGVVSAVRDGRRRVFIVGNARLGHPEAVQDIAAKARGPGQVDGAGAAAPGAIAAAARGLRQAPRAVGGGPPGQALTCLSGALSTRQAWRDR
ncbi:MAG TPA: hypothetical protein VGH57_11605 [Amycolatopsis sp.]